MYLLSSASPAASPATSHQPAPPPDAMRASAHSAAGPEEQQRRVRRHHHRADAEQQRGVQQRSGGDPRAPARQQPFRRIGQQHGAERRRERPQQPDAERPLPGQRGARPNPQRHHRRMIEIAGRQGVRPHPVIGLVGRQRQHSRHDQPQQGHRRQGGGGKPHFARQTSVAETA